MKISQSSRCSRHIHYHIIFVFVPLDYFFILFCFGALLVIKLIDEKMPPIACAWNLMNFDHGEYQATDAHSVAQFTHLSLTSNILAVSSGNLTPSSLATQNGQNDKKLDKLPMVICSGSLNSRLATAAGVIRTRLLQLFSQLTAFTTIAGKLGSHGSRQTALFSHNKERGQCFLERPDGVTCGYLLLWYLQLTVHSYSVYPYSHMACCCPIFDAWHVTCKLVVSGEGVNQAPP